jgi:hypothetical protein
MKNRTLNVLPSHKKPCKSTIYRVFYDLVARRGIEPLISRMKTWRPNRLDERANISFGSAKVLNYFRQSKKKMKAPGLLIVSLRLVKAGF